MSDLELDKWIGKIESAKAARKLKLINGDVGEISEANDRLCCGDKGLCEIADGGSKNRAG